MRMSRHTVTPVSLPTREHAFTKQTQRAESLGRRGDCNDSADSTHRSLTADPSHQLRQSVTLSQLRQSVTLPAKLALPLIRAVLRVCVECIYVYFSFVPCVACVVCCSPCVRVLRGDRLLLCLRSAFVLRLRPLSPPFVCPSSSVTNKDPTAINRIVVVRSRTSVHRLFVPRLPLQEGWHTVLLFFSAGAGGVCTGGVDCGAGSTSPPTYPLSTEVDDMTIGSTHALHHLQHHARGWGEE